jgi:ATP-dependent Clp protease protease subunit
MLSKADEEVEETATAVESSENVDVDATLRKCGIFYIWGDITPGGLKDIHQDLMLKHWQGPKHFNSPVQLIINSNGGDVDETNSLLDLLANVRFNVATSGFGTCASAGAQLLASGTKGLRTVAPNATVMIHSYSWGNAGKHHELVAHRRAQDGEYEKEIAFWIKASKYNTRAQVEKHLLRKADTWLTAKEALNHGIVDHVAGVLR